MQKKGKKGSTYIHKDGIDIIGAIVALKGCDVGPEIVGCNEKKKRIHKLCRYFRFLKFKIKMIIAL